MCIFNFSHTKTSTPFTKSFMKVSLLVVLVPALIRAAIASSGFLEAITALIRAGTETSPLGLLA